MILVVQLPGGSTRLDVAPVEHYQVPDLILRGLGALGIRVAAHSFMCCFQPFGGRPVCHEAWRDRLLGAAAGVALTLATLWLILVSTATATVILCA